MSLCKSGQILNCCHPNALMTLTEFLVDYASDETRNIGYEMISREIEKIPNEKVRELTRQHVADIRSSTGVISGSDFKTVKIYSEGK